MILREKNEMRYQHMKRVTVFTPTYNRANVLHRVYNSLVNQTYRDFTWLIIDDGSTDNTRTVVENFVSEGLISINYVFQDNKGKHIATNNAVKMSQSELFIIADSDDAFVPESLQKLVAAWDSISDVDKPGYKGVICRCFDSNTKRPIGTFPKQVFDSNDIDGYFKLKLNFEKWMLLRTDVLREFPFPGEGLGLKFFPETVIWRAMARKYKTRYISDPLREYYRDQENALTHADTPRFRENLFLWVHYVNDMMDYFWSMPLIFIKAFVGINRDAIVTGRTFVQILQLPNKGWKKVITAIFYPIGWMLSIKHVAAQRNKGK